MLNKCNNNNRAAADIINVIINTFQIVYLGNCGLTSLPDAQS